MPRCVYRDKSQYYLHTSGAVEILKTTRSRPEKPNFGPNREEVERVASR